MRWTQGRTGADEPTRDRIGGTSEPARRAMILDAHVHFWDLQARDYPWLTEIPALRRRFGPEDYEPGRHSVEGVVFVQADCAEEQTLSEVAWAADLANRYPLVRGIVAYAPVHLGEQARDAIAAIAAKPLVIGVRRLLQGEPPDVLADPALAAGIRLLAAHDLPFDVCVTHDQLPAVTRLIAACPDVSFVLDHLGKPAVGAGLLDPWRDAVAKLAALPNVVCKLSGLATEASSGWRAADLRPFLDHALEVFGPRRCMVGSDWPVATLATSVEHWFDLITVAVEQLAADERRAVLSECARATYGIGAPLSPAASSAR